MSLTPLASSAAAQSATICGATRNAICKDSTPFSGGVSLKRRPWAVSASRRSDAILDPAIAQGTQQRELHNGFVEVPHRFHVAGKDDGVVDLANMAERLHGGSLRGRRGGARRPADIAAGQRGACGGSLERADRPICERCSQIALPFLVCRRRRRSSLIA